VEEQQQSQKLLHKKKTASFVTKEAFKARTERLKIEFDKEKNWPLASAIIGLDAYGEGKTNLDLLCEDYSTFEKLDKDKAESLSKQIFRAIEYRGDLDPELRKDLMIRALEMQLFQKLDKDKAESLSKQIFSAIEDRGDLDPELRKDLIIRVSEMQLLHGQAKVGEYFTLAQENLAKQLAAVPQPQPLARYLGSHKGFDAINKFVDRLSSHLESHKHFKTDSKTDEDKQALDQFCEQIKSLLQMSSTMTLDDKGPDSTKSKAKYSGVVGAIETYLEITEMFQKKYSKEIVVKGLSLYGIHDLRVKGYFKQITDSLSTKRNLFPSPQKTLADVGKCAEDLDSFYGKAKDHSETNSFGQEQDQLNQAVITINKLTANKKVVGKDKYDNEVSILIKLRSIFTDLLANSKEREAHHANSQVREDHHANSQVREGYHKSELRRERGGSIDRPVDPSSAMGAAESVVGHDKLQERRARVLEMCQTGKLKGNLPDKIAFSEGEFFYNHSKKGQLNIKELDSKTLQKVEKAFTKPQPKPRGEPAAEEAAQGSGQRWSAPPARAARYEEDRTTGQGGGGDAAEEAEQGQSENRAFNPALYGINHSFLVNDLIKRTEQQSKIDYLKDELNGQIPDGQQQATLELDQAVIKYNKSDQNLSITFAGEDPKILPDGITPTNNQRIMSCLDKAMQTLNPGPHGGFERI